MSLLSSSVTLIHESYAFTGGVSVHPGVCSDWGRHGDVVHPALGRPETQSQDQLTFLNPGPSLAWKLCFLFLISTRFKLTPFSFTTDNMLPLLQTVFLFYDLFYFSKRLSQSRETASKKTLFVF